MRIAVTPVIFATHYILAAFFLTAGAFGGETVPVPATPPVSAVTTTLSYEDELALVREKLFAQYEAEARRGAVSVGTRLAWSLIRIGAADPETRIDLANFRHDEASAEISLRHRGGDAHIRMDESDLGKRLRATVGGYAFTAGYTVLLQKPLAWMAETARAFRAAGVEPGLYPEWEVAEAPEGLIAFAFGDGEAFSRVRRIPLAVFYRGAFRTVEPLSAPADFDALREDFLAAAEALHKGVMEDETITPQLRQALAPVLAGTYSQVDPRDYFDSDFCRRVIEADYLEKHIAPLSPARAAELARYRETLAKIEAGVDRFAIDLGEDGRLVAVTRPEIDEKSDEEGDDENAAAFARDPETGEALPPYDWRWERADNTLFHSPLPSRYLYAMSVLEKFPGRHTARPAGIPALTEVWHAVLGRLAWYESGGQQITVLGDTEKWQEAVELDARGGRDPNAGPLGWSFPLFVPVRNDQGDPVLIATERGVVPGPDFAAVTDEAARRAAQDEWLANTSAVLATPGELNLIYRIFFRYCSDSPLPELPNLIGSHLGLSDTHQTVYQTLDRRWAGRLIGDCDDMAEFFQNLAQRQGKLVHIMQLPAHAAAGWLDVAPDVNGYEFVVLQTGPALRFTADTRIAAVEKAYRHFDKDVGESQFSSAAVPLLLRFANEDTRTPFVLSARIYWDRRYAEDMIKVQEYWHLHTFSAGIATMERMIAAGDRDPGNLKELAGLYEQAGLFEKAAALREEELAAAGDDEPAALSALLDMARLRRSEEDKPAALNVLEQMRARLDALRLSNPPRYAQAFAYRSGWAGLLAQIGEPERAWALLQYDVEEAEKNGWRVSEPLMRVLATLYGRMAIRRDREGEIEDPAQTDIRFSVRNALSHAFGKGYFQKDDSFNTLFSRYYWLGRYAVGVEGRQGGLAKLAADGPYPAPGSDFAARRAERAEDLTEQDWEWFRITPRLLLGLGLEMLDKDDNPELYDPAGARDVLALVARAAAKGAAAGAGGLLGREAVLQGELALSFIDADLAKFTALMEEVRSRNYSGLYDNAAVMFGSHFGLVPLTEFDAWAEAFHRFFPGRQNYFKAAYRMLYKGSIDHAVRFARATAGFFPDDPLLVAEARALEGYAADFRARAEDACNASAESVK